MSGIGRVWRAAGSLPVLAGLYAALAGVSVLAGLVALAVGVRFAVDGRMRDPDTAPSDRAELPEQVSSNC